MKKEFKNLKELLTFNIKYYRYLNNISQERLAELSSLSPRYLTDIERGLHCPTINKIEIIIINTILFTFNSLVLYSFLKGFNICSINFNSITITHN